MRLTEINKEEKRSGGFKDNPPVSYNLLKLMNIFFWIFLSAQLALFQNAEGRRNRNSKYNVFYFVESVSKARLMH